MFYFFWMTSIFWSITCFHFSSFEAYSKEIGFSLVNKAKFTKSSFKLFLNLKNLFLALYFPGKSIWICQWRCGWRRRGWWMEKNEENKIECIPLHHHVEFMFLLLNPHKHIAFCVICTLIPSRFFIELCILTNNKL